MALKNASQGTTGIDHVRKKVGRGSDDWRKQVIRQTCANGAIIIRRLEDNMGTETRGRRRMERDCTDLRTIAVSVVQAGAFLRITAHPWRTVTVPARAPTRRDAQSCLGVWMTMLGSHLALGVGISDFALTSGDDIVLHILFPLK
jgi:hypothetical protein